MERFIDLAALFTPSDAPTVSMRPAALRFLAVTWGQATIAVTGLLGISIYTKILEPSAYGKCMLAQGMVALFDSIGILALNQTLMSMCSLRQTDEDRRRIAVGLSWASLRLAAPTALMIGLVIGSTAAGSGAGVWWIALPVATALYTAAEIGKTSLLSLLMLAQKYGRCSAWLAVESLTTVGVTTLSLAYWQPNPLGFIGGLALAHALSTAAFIAMYAPGHLRRPTQPLSREEVRPAIRHGLPVAIMGPLGWVSTFLDRYLLAALLGTAATGTYSATTSLIARPYSVLSAVLTNYFRPLYYQKAASGRSHDRIMWNWVILSVALGGCGGLGALLFGDLLTTTLLGAAYRKNTTTIMVLFAVAQTLVVTTHAADNALLAMGRGDRLMRAQAFLAIATIPIVAIGVATGGIYGALTGRCVSEAIKLVVVLRLARTAGGPGAGPRRAASEDRVSFGP